MKIKPIYIYIAIAVAAVLFLILFTGRENEKPEMSENMPQDDIHKQFNQEQPPGKGNVSEEFYRQLEMMRKEVEENPGDTSRLMKYADYLTAAHQFESAIPLYQEILDRDSKRTDVYFALTYIYYSKKDFAKAEEITNKVLAYDKNNLQAQYNLGAINAAAGNNEKAREIWTNLAEKNPGSREASLANESLKQLK